MSNIGNDKKKKLPKGIVDRQQEQRNRSRELVQDAITELKAEGRKVTMKGIQEITGFARSTLSKPHIDDILKINKVCKYEIKNELVPSNNNKTLHDLKLEIQALEKAINRLIKENNDLRNKNNSLQVELFEQKDKNEKLLGEIQCISTKCRMNNIRLEIIEEDDNTTLELIKR